MTANPGFGKAKITGSIEGPFFPGEMQSFTTGATRSADEDKLDYEGFLSPFVLERYAQYLHKHRIQADGQPRESDNWQKGMPRARYLKSAIRHMIDTWKEWRRYPGNEAAEHFQDLLCAILFNVIGLLHEILVGRDIRD